MMLILRLEADNGSDIAELAERAVLETDYS